MPPRVELQWQFSLPLPDYGAVGAALRDTACASPYDDERAPGMDEWESECG
jgi:hypothetical protein